MVHFSKQIAIAVALAMAANAEPGSIRRGVSEAEAETPIEKGSGGDVKGEIFKDIENVLHGGKCIHIDAGLEDAAATGAKDRSSAYVTASRVEEDTKAELGTTEIGTAEIGTAEIGKEAERTTTITKHELTLGDAPDVPNKFDNFCEDTEGREVVFYDQDIQLRYCCHKDQFNYAELARVCKAKKDGPRVCINPGGHGVGITLESGFFSICCEADGLFSASTNKSEEEVEARAKEIQAQARVEANDVSKLRGGTP